MKIAIVSLVIVAAGVGLWFVFGRATTTKANNAEQEVAALFRLATDQPDTLIASADALKRLKFETAGVLEAPPADPLMLPGSLLLDPNQLVRVHARFSGEVVSIGSPKVSPSETAPTTAPRTFRYGDRVHKGDLLVVLWSKEIGEKKSELIEAVSRLELDRALLSRLEAVEKGVVPERTIYEAKRNVEADVIAAARAERTLHSWRFTDAEISLIYREARELRQTLDPRSDDDVEKSWAELEVRAPMDGVILEKNFNVGDIVDPEQDLFKIANLDPVQVMASVYEEDLPSLKRLPADQREWTIEMRSSTNEPPVKGLFDVIGSVIDPAQHTGVVMGWLPNPQGALSAGQFITATVQLPRDPAMVAIPTSALIEEGTVGAVFVETAPGQFQRRDVAVTRRGRSLVFVRSEPTPTEAKSGLKQLRGGERVVVSGGLQLLAELNSLQPGAGP